MSYEKITFVDRIAEYPTRRKLTTIDTQQPFGTYDVSRDEGTVSQEGTALNAATFNALQANVESAFVEVDDNIASAYDETSTYAQGDFCIYEGVLYQANQDIETAEEWDSTHWDSVKLTDIMGTGSASIDDTVVASDKTWSSEHIAAFLPEDSASGAIASFPDGANKIPCPSVLCTITPVQSGSGDPSPSNVRPITGHTELNLVHTGANIWDEEWELGIINSTTGEDEPNNSYIRSKGYTRVEANTSVYCVTSAPLRLVFYDKDKEFVGIANGNNTVVTMPNNTKYLRFYVNNSQYGTTYKNDISINYPSTDTSYHAYTGTTTTTALGTTVYGGTLDVVSGELTIDRAEVDLGSLSWSYITSGSIPRFQANLITNAKPLEDNTKIANAISEIFGVNSWSNVTNVNTYDNTLALNAGGTVITVHCSSYTDADNFDTAVTGKYICYELATPTTTQLTPQEVKSLLGSNNFYHDCNGQVAVTYKADIGLYIAKKTN